MENVVLNDLFYELLYVKKTYRVFDNKIMTVFLLSENTNVSGIF